MRELSTEGLLKDQSVILRDMGYDIGHFVERKADKAKGKIIEFVGDKVKLEQEDGTKCLAVIESFLKGQWQKFTPKSDPEMIDTITNATEHKDFLIPMLVSKINVSLCKLTTTHTEINSKLKHHAF